MRRKQKRKKDKKPKKSPFTLFFESLEERGPLTPSSGAIYERWTRNVRRQMENARTWPTLLQEPDISIVADYVSRLQAVFWRTIRQKWYAKKSLYDLWRKAAEWTRIRPYLKVLRMIHDKIRMMGMRTRGFFLHPWSTLRTPTLTWVYRERYGLEQIDIRPWIPFNNHGDGI